MLLFVLSAWLIVGVSIAAAQEITVTEPHRYAISLKLRFREVDFQRFLFKRFPSLPNTLVPYSSVFCSSCLEGFL